MLLYTTHVTCITSWNTTSSHSCPFNVHFTRVTTQRWKLHQLRTNFDFHISRAQSHIHLCPHTLLLIIQYYSSIFHRKSSFQTCTFPYVYHWLIILYNLSSFAFQSVHDTVSWVVVSLTIIINRMNHFTIQASFPWDIMIMVHMDRRTTNFGYAWYLFCILKWVWSVWLFSVQ